MRRSWLRLPLQFAALLAVGYGGTLAWEHFHTWNANGGQLIAHKKSGADQQPTVANAAADDPAIRFEGIAHEAGIDFRYEPGPAGQYHLAETLGGGVGVFDLDNDGHLDLLFVDGGDPIRWPELSPDRHRLYRNRGDGNFEEVSQEAGLNWRAYGHGCAVGDIDNDGFADLLLTGYQSVALFLNQGDGTLREVTAPAGVTTDRWAATAAFGDLDLDGDLDLYVTCYAATPRSLPTPDCRGTNGARIQCRPHTYDAQSDLLFENLGDGRFADRSESSGIAGHSEYGLGVVIANLDADDLPEIFVANDGRRNHLYQNLGKWRFSETALAAGVAYNSEGQSMGSMGIACGDALGSELSDLFVSNFQDERNVLYENQGSLQFFDQSLGTSVDRRSRPLVGWGSVFLDADEDGWLDLFVANGHVAEYNDASIPFAQPAFFYRNRAKRDLQDVSTAAGAYFREDWIGRGAAWGDVDNDGRPDLAVSHVSQPAALLLNRSSGAEKRVVVELIGRRSNRMAANARIEATVNDALLAREVQPGAGYLSSSDTRVHLGLGDADRIDKLTIRWPSGAEQELDNIVAGSRLLVLEPP